MVHCSNTMPINWLRNTFFFCCGGSIHISEKLVVVAFTTTGSRGSDLTNFNQTNQSSQRIVEISNSRKIYEVPTARLCAYDTLYICHLMTPCTTPLVSSWWESHRSQSVSVGGTLWSSASQACQEKKGIQSVLAAPLNIKTSLLWQKKEFLFRHTNSIKPTLNDNHNHNSPSYSFSLSVINHDFDVNDHQFLPTNFWNG